MKNKSDRNNILYLAHHALGDVVMKAPAIRYLTTHFKKEEIFITTRDTNIDSFLINHLSVCRKNLINYHSSMSLLEKIKLIITLRKLNIKYFILPSTINNLSGNILYRLIGAKKIICKELFSPNSKIFPNSHKVVHNIQFTKFFEEWSDGDLYQWAKNNFYLDNINDENLDRKLVHKKYFMIHPGSGDKEIFKRYPVHRWIDLIKKIRTRYPNYYIYLSGTGNEQEQNQTIKKIFKNDRMIVDFSNKLDLKSFIIYLKHSSLFLSADCGPTHLCSIVNSKMITLFGATNPKYTGPFKNSINVIANSKLDCMPCYGTKKYGSKGCPSVDCMNLIQNDQIMNEISQIHSLENK